jgi:hypothetical protein
MKIKEALKELEKYNPNLRFQVWSDHFEDWDDYLEMVVEHYTKIYVLMTEIQYLKCVVVLI